MHTKLIALFTGLALAPFAWPVRAPAQISVVPGSAARGATLFREKSCIECHAETPRAATPTLLAAAMWNHSPNMWRAQQERNLRPMLDSPETADLFAYFFSLAYFRVPGDAARGRAVFESASCANCHDIRIQYGHPNLFAGPPISTWNEVSDPLAWTERMWNHSEQIYRERSAVGLAWPQLSTEQMIDLIAYLRSVPEARAASISFTPGDPELGRITFENTCESCHSFGSRTAVPKIDLSKRPASDSLIGYVTAMWNHAPKMRERAGKDFPILGPGDMSNLVAYLFARRYFEDQGDVQRGAKVFESKNCATCHASGKAPDLAMAAERYSPITMVSAVWRHGPQMVEAMRQRDIAWPQFSGREMADLIAFLNNRLVIRMNGAEN